VEGLLRRVDLESMQERLELHVVGRLLVHLQFGFVISLILSGFFLKRSAFIGRDLLPHGSKLLSDLPNTHAWVLVHYKPTSLVCPHEESREWTLRGIFINRLLGFLPEAVLKLQNFFHVELNNHFDQVD